MTDGNVGFLVLGKRLPTHGRIHRLASWCSNLAKQTTRNSVSEQGGFGVALKRGLKTEMKPNNDNVNGFLKPPIPMNIDNDNVKYERGRQVEVIADRLLKEFKLDEGSRSFMCKVAYKLSEARIWQHVEHVNTPPKNGKPITNKVGLFIWLCKRDGV